MKLTLFVLGLFLSTIAFADTAQIVTLKGTATFQGKPLSKTSTLEGEGELVVGEKSYLKLKLKESQTEVVFGAHSSSKIDLSQPVEKQEVSLLKGVARWISGGKKGQGVRTANATLGIRGTDFLTTYNPLLGETEVICFDGQVQMTNEQEKSDSKLVSKNQWGGIGGRFGKKLSEILTLTPELMKNFEEALRK